jgi:hypothetical protein
MHENDVSAGASFRCGPHRAVDRLVEPVVAALLLSDNLEVEQVRKQIDQVVLARNISGEPAKSYLSVKVSMWFESKSNCGVDLESTEVYVLREDVDDVDPSGTPFLGEASSRDSVAFRVIKEDAVPSFDPSPTTITS